MLVYDVEFAQKICKVCNCWKIESVKFFLDKKKIFQSIVAY